MITRQEIEAYFTNLYKDSIIFDHTMNVMKSKTDEELQKIYEISIRREKEENEILNNGTTTYRFSYETNQDEKEIIEYMQNNEMYTIEDGRINYRIRVGNYCIVGVPAHQLEQLKEHFGNRIKYVDLERTIVSRKMIHDLKEGDKVKLVLDGIFGLQTAQGTVFSIEDNQITIRQYRSKTKGYVLNVGQYGHIEKVKAFQKVS